MAETKTVLLVEDDGPLREILKITLESPPIRVVEVATGGAALRAIAFQPPDLVVLDWVLPGISGIEVAEAIRAAPEFRHLPIIMLTARCDQADFRRSQACGVFAHLSKPFSPLALRRTVEEALQPVPAPRRPEPWPSLAAGRSTRDRDG